MRLAAVLALALASCSSLPEMAPGRTEAIAISGELMRADHQTYKELPFVVPRGVTRVAVDLTYTGRDQRTVVDLGLRDPDGQRGWSGGNKSHIEVAGFDATPSYFPGPIQPGEWRVVLGVPNIREGQTAQFDVTVTLSSAPVEMRKEVALATDPVLSTEAGWRRGDFHMHTEHSDGSCDDGAGKRGPCALAKTVDAARDAKLDFIAITEHNTLSQRDAMRELQLAFPSLLLIPGTEVTTFWGHANAVGLSEPLEFQLKSPRLPDLAPLMDRVEAQGAFLSINHPRQPSGEVCMGCGWTAETDFARVGAIEVVNGSIFRLGGPESATSGIPFWEEKLNQGYRITAIGGSDNHDPTDREGARQSPVGRPATVVWAQELSAKGIVAGVKSGRVFVDVAGLPGASFDIGAVAGSSTAQMGGELRLPPGEGGMVIVSTSGLPPGARIEPVARNLVGTGQAANAQGGLMVSFDMAPGETRGWIRANVRDADGKLLLLGNPIYVVAKGS